MNYQLKIKLKDISKPPVWRRLLIPVKATFGELHLAIQAVFGWQMRHLYRFSDKVSDFYESKRRRGCDVPQLVRIA